MAPELVLPQPQRSDAVALIDVFKSIVDEGECGGIVCRPVSSDVKITATKETDMYAVAMLVLFVRLPNQLRMQTTHSDL